MSNAGQPRLSAGMAVAIGHLMITFPMLLISCMAVTLLVLITRNWRIGIVGLIIGIVVAGVWWVLVTPFWRRWALGKGVPPDQLHRWAMLTGLVLPGSNPVREASVRTPAVPGTQISAPTGDDDIAAPPDQ
jgi:hypothetical protein